MREYRVYSSMVKHSSRSMTREISFDILVEVNIETCEVTQRYLNSW